MNAKNYRILGKVIDQKTRAGIPGLRIEVWDKDLIFDDLLGSAVTGEQGAFEIAFSESHILELFAERRPDIFFKIFRDNELVQSTENSVLWNVEAGEIPVVIEGDFPVEPAKALLVSGQVRYDDGKPAAAARVRAIDKDLRKEAVLGEAKTDAQGRYEINYTADQFARPGKACANLALFVLDSKDKPLASSPIRFNAGPRETVDLVLPTVIPRLSEYELLLAGLSPALMDLHPADLTDEDITFLSGEAAVPSEHISLLRQAARLAKDSQLPDEVFYGLAKQGLVSNDPSNPFSQPLPALRRGLESAIKANLIPKVIESQLDTIMERLRALLVKHAFQSGPEPGRVTVGALLGASRLSRAAQEKLVAAAMEHEGAQEDFWTRLKETPEFRDASQITEVRLTMQLGALTGYHPPMVEALRGVLGDKPSIKDLVNLDTNQWLVLVRSMGIPAGISGDSEEARVRTYAKSLREQVEAAFPSAAIIAQVNRAGIFKADQSHEFNAFFAANPNFDLLTDSVERTVATQSLSEEVRTKIKHIQRLARVTPNTQAFQALYDGGISSASHIASMSEGAFLARYGEALDDEQLCRSVYRSAAQRKNITQELRIRYAREMSYLPKPIPPALPYPSLTSSTFSDSPQTPETPFTPFTPSQWDKLFGSTDVCACQECRSVLGPAAYLTNLLHFIDRETVRWDRQFTGLDALFVLDRRPDIQEILLNCQNALTPLPYIDLVNEILERVVAQEGSIRYQTTWSPSELAANPEHIEPKAYTDVLKEAIFPWNLPLDLYAEEARIYLAHLGTSRHELMEIFYYLPDMDPLRDETIAREYLKLSTKEWMLIGMRDAGKLWQLWGLLHPMNDDTVINVLKHPQQLLDRAGITFNELEMLLLTGFVNGSGKLQINYMQQCTLEETSINFEDDLDAPRRICRFVRLWRVLGYSIPELDAALTVFRNPEIIYDVPLLILSQVQRLRDRLEMPIIELLALYGDLDQLPSPAYLSLCTDQNRLPIPVGNPGSETLFDSVFFSRKLAPQDNETFKEKMDYGKYLFNAGLQFRTQLNNKPLSLSSAFRQLFNNQQIVLPTDDHIRIDIEVPDSRWRIYVFECAEYVVINTGQQLAFYRIGIIADYLPQVTAALGISSGDLQRLESDFSVFFDINQDQKIQLTRANLSRLYRIVRLCRAADLTVPEYIELVDLTLTDPNQGPVVAWPGDAKSGPIRTLAFLGTLDFVRNSGFGIQELAGVLRCRYAPGVAEAFLRQDAVILQQLRTGLQKIDADLHIPVDAAPGELETALRQKLGLVLQPDEVVLIMNWLQSDPVGLPNGAPADPGRDKKKIDALTELDTKLAVCLELRIPDPGDPNNTILHFYPEPAKKAEERAAELLNLYTKVMNSLRPYLRDLLGRNLIKQQIGQALGLEPALSEQLLQSWVAACGVSNPNAKANAKAIDAFLDSDFAAPQNRPPSLVQENYSMLAGFAKAKYFNGPFQTLARLRKVALVLARLNVTFTEAGYLFSEQDKGWLDLAHLPIDEPPQDTQLFTGWHRLVDVCGLHHRLGSATPNLFDLFNVAVANINQPIEYNDTQKLCDHPFVKILLPRTGWIDSDFGELIHNFSYQIADFTDERAFLRLEICFQLSRRLGATIANMVIWGMSDLDSEVSGNIKANARACYPDEEAWDAVARPLQNALRERKRAALVRYLCGVWSWKTDQLYSHFLIDPEMSACMLTSRIKQAISSVQLFIQRIFLGIEYTRDTQSGKSHRVEFSHPADARIKWEWMKNYRLWEANRQVFLFPENWIYPELRDDKSPFFKELENELRQGEITPQSVEKAYLNYLNKLDIVSNLEIVGQYYDEENNNYHVFGRTSSTPFVYYYRYRNQAEIWSAWEKIPLDIEGEQLIPVVWNRRLYLFWPIFKEETQQPTTEQNQASGERKRFWTIKMAWSERWQSGKITRPIVAGWTPKQETKLSMKPQRRKLIEDKKDPYEPIYVDSTSSNKRYFSFRAICTLDQNLTISCWYIRTNYIDSKILDKIQNRPVECIPFHYHGKIEDAGYSNTIIAFESAIAEWNLVGRYPYTEYNFDCGYWKAENLKINIPNLITLRENLCIETGIPSSAQAIELSRLSILNSWSTTRKYLHDVDYCSTDWDAQKFYIRDPKVDFDNAIENNDQFTELLSLPAFDDLIDILRSYRVFKEVRNEFIFRGSGRVDIEPNEAIAIDTLTVSSPSATLENMALQFPTSGENVLFKAALPLPDDNPPQDWNSSAKSTIFWWPVPTSFSLHFLTQDPVVWWWPFIYQDAESSLLVWPCPYKGPSKDDPYAEKYKYAYLLTPDSNPPENFFTYYVYRFYHPYIGVFKQELNRVGIDGLLHQSPHPDYVPDNAQGLYRQQISQNWDYADTNYHSQRILNGKDKQPPYPNKEISFLPDDAYSLYNWELFFHIPLLIAERLRQDQQFEAAMKWFHYIFDPLDPSHEDNEEEWMRPWRLRRFCENPDAQKRIEDLMANLKGDTDLNKQVENWSLDPFEPHLIARMRITPYMKTVVMKYLDNLIEWGDQLFRRDTIESINEATQLYILAAEVLGDRPRQLPERKHTDLSYAEIKELLAEKGEYFDDFSNFLEGELSAASTTFSSVANAIANADVPEVIAQLDSILNSAGKLGSPTPDLPPTPPSALNLPPPGLYFCIPQNDKLLGYWDTVADRLFKIRHCMNIEGAIRELPLYEPPIDPGLLVKAKAAGVDFSTILNDLSAPAPHYRFAVLVQKAADLCQEVKALGAALLSALEKRDAEGLALLRSDHEITLLGAVREVRRQQIDEATNTLQSLGRSKELAEIKSTYYSQLITNGLLEEEKQQPNKFDAANESEAQAVNSDNLAAFTSSVKDASYSYSHSINTGTPGGTSNGYSISKGVSGIFDWFTHVVTGFSNHSTAQIESRTAEKLGIVATQKRRKEEWIFQKDLANKESKQLDKQIAAAEIREQIANLELENHELQIGNSKAVDDYMRSKFTNQDLYDWMVGQIAETYFQSYQLAFDTARRAERAYRFELGLGDSGFISFGYWDSLRKGLLSGERLYHDLKRMETAYLEQNKREYEITKHVSLALLDPVALVSLRHDGQCFVDLPEALFDLDCPGHFMRRIKSISLTIPCVAGPYTSVNCTLTLLNSKVRAKGIVTGGYKYDPDDPNYISSSVAQQSIVTSSAQNDSGLFELNFRDERYLPFEGAGAISSWRIELPREFRQFDYDTITDVIMHVRYTAREGGAVLRNAALNALTTQKGPLFQPVKDNPLLTQLIGDAQTTADKPESFLLLSAKHDFPTEWYRFTNAANDPALEIRLIKNLFPYQVHNKTINISRVGVAVIFKGKVGSNSASIKVTAPKSSLTAVEKSKTYNLNEVLMESSSSPVFAGNTEADLEKVIKVYEDSQDSSTKEDYSFKLSEISLNSAKIDTINEILLVFRYSTG